MIINAQTYDDARSLQRRQSHDGESSRRHHHSSLSDKADSTTATSTTAATANESSSSPFVCNIFAASNVSDPFDTIISENANQSSEEPQKTVETRPGNNHYL